MPDIHNEGANLGQQNIDSNVYNYYGEKKIKKFLGVLPFFSETFLGREDDLKEVHRKLFEEGNLLLLVNGEGGIGKTTLAARYYLTYQHEYQHLAWVFSGTSLADALLTLAIPMDIRFPDTMLGEERLEALLDALRNLKQPCLLIIDNANEIGDLEAHYLALRKCGNFHLLLTTRTTGFGRAATHRIEPLEKRSAIALFKEYYPGHRDTEDGLLENILVAVGYNTLVIELLAKNLQNLNRLETHYNLAALLHDLQSKGSLALSQVSEVSTTYHAAGFALRKEKPDAIIEAIYQLSGLTKEEISLAISYENLGEARASLGNIDKALQFYQQFNILIKEIYAAYPQNVSFKNGLAISYGKLGLTHEQVQNKDEAKNYYKLSQEVLMELVSRFPEYVEFKKNLDWVQKRLSED